jgi:hypothetical protein
LDLEIEQAVKETAAEVIRTRLSNPFREAIAGDVSIVGYYGTYNDCVAVLLHDTFTDYPCVIWEESIAGVTFVYSGANILIWNDNKKQTKKERSFINFSKDMKVSKFVVYYMKP